MPLPVLPSALLDPAGRRMEYLRLSVTSACNFRCVYCLPDGYHPTPDAPDALRVDEVDSLVRALATVGLGKVRLTGGEPTVRRDLLELVRTVAAVPGIHTVALSTNGWNLAKMARAFRDAGLKRVNVSVDSLDRGQFAAITGRDLLPRVLAGVDAALAAGLQVKVNTVLMRELSGDVLAPLLDYVRDRPVTVRLIELMRTRENGPFFLRQHQSLDALKAQLEMLGFTPRPREKADGPAQEYVHPGYRGGVGLIAPYSRDFCATCNRLRVTSTGDLRLCLFGDGAAPLRPWLQPHLQEELVQRVCGLVGIKPPAHRLHQQISGNVSNLAQMGG